MKTNRVLWSLMAACLVAILAGTLTWGQGVASSAPASVPAGMVLIKAGTNTGTDPDTGAYSLKVNAFYIDRHETTKALWDEVYAWAIKNGYQFDNAGSGKAADHPVVTLNWFDCVKWCNARSEKEGRPVCYRVGGKAVYRTGQNYVEGLTCDMTVTGYRLPTVTEWEYAARGGLKDKRFPWGDTIDHDKANYMGYPSGLPYDKGYAGYDKRYFTDEASLCTAPVGSFPANGYGLYDMAGNAWEWCWPLSLNTPLRGGSGFYSADYCRIVGQFGLYGNVTGSSFGFRCVVTSDK